MKAPVFYSPDLRQYLLAMAQAYRQRNDPEVGRLIQLAIMAAPLRLDLRFCNAARLIQARKVEEAIECYREILEIAPRDVDSLVYLAQWSRYLGRNDDAAAALHKLKVIRPSTAGDIRRLWDRMDMDANLPVSDRIPEPMYEFSEAGNMAAIVILGYQLNSDGSMRDILLGRLRKGLEAARKFPEAYLILTGGVPHGGTVEAVEMRKWLIENGVDPQRIIEEGYSRDVVENVRFTRHILEIFRITNVLIITSALDLRRTRLSLDVAAWKNGSSWIIQSVASEVGEQSFSRDDGPGDIKIYRDTLRVYGMLTMRIFPELVEM